MATLVPQTVFTKTAKGILEIRNKSTRLPRELSAVLECVDGTASVADLHPRSGIAGAQLHHALNTLVADGYIKAVASPAAATPARDPSAVQFDSPDEVARLNMELATHALASAEAAKVAQQEGRAALEARLRAEAEARARAAAELRLQSEAEARAAADAAARTAQHARDHADQDAAAAGDADARVRAQADSRNATTAALRARAEAQARAEAEARVRALVEEKKAAENRARDEAQAHAEAEQRAQERVAAEDRARDALQAQIDAAAAVRSPDDVAARARLHEREEAAERARAEAEAVAQAQGVKTEQPTENLHFDDLAQRLTARVHAERKARDDAARQPHAEGEAPARGPKDGFPPLEFRSSASEAEPAPAADRADAPEALPAIDMSNGAGRGDVRHVTPEHVPSALERAMMEREARTQSESQDNGGADVRPATASGARAGAATTLTARAPQSTYESKREAAAAAAAPVVFTPKSDITADKPAPTLVEDKEPGHERLNVDRTAHDILADSAEERRKAEVAALSRQAADLRRQRQDEEARRVAREERERKRRTASRTLTTVLIGAPLLTIAWLQFVPLNSYIPDAQQALSTRLNQPTTVSTVRYVLLPTPRIVLEGVRIGSAQAVHVERVEARAWPGALLGGPLELSTVDASGVAIDPGMLATIPAWTGGRSAGTLHVSRLRLSDVKLGSADAKSAGMNGEVVFAANGTVNQASLANENLKIEIVPQQSGVKVVLNANNWRVPFGPAVVFSYLTVEGIADKERFATTQLAGRIGGGTVTGTLAARWEGPTIVGGELRIEGSRIDEAVQQLAPNLRVKGVLSANVRYAMQADSASGLMEKALVDGTFSIIRGELGAIDLARAVQLPGTPTGGRTVFDELKGSVQINGNRYGYRNLQLASGPLEATGYIEVARAGQLSGRIDAQMSSRSTVVGRSSFTVRGTVKEPQLAR